jgi:hypothetical protein
LGSPNDRIDRIDPIDPIDGIDREAVRRRGGQ